ncbi:MAG TPA: type IV pilin protein [Steroidobacteraceae bacterium]|nr:type IV pilin protein [Steroidobacteraceae bacterium]
MQDMNDTPLHRRSIRSAGFTLIELMVVVVILAIVIAIAVPTYTSQVQQSRRTEARTAALDLASREEKYFSTANSYSFDPTQLGYAAVGSGADFPQSTGNYYQITVDVPSPNWVGSGPSFLVIVTPATGSSQNNDIACGKFEVDQTGNQTAYTSSGTQNNTCWQQ